MGSHFLKTYMKISAFIPVTNSLKRGDTFLEAIISHLYWADEMVIVDGGSTDGTIEAILNLKDPRIKIITRPWVQEGWSWSEFPKAWNAGLDACSGDWVAAGESDHIFHENEAQRVREEVERETRKGKAVMRCQKMQSAAWDKWSSKSQMYYFIYKAKFPQIRYGFDPKHETDLTHPIWWDMSTMYEDIPQGTAIREDTEFAGLIGGTGANIYNYLWTFKTKEMIITERMKAMKGWNLFSGFTDIYKKRMPEDREAIEKQLNSQIKGVHEKSTRHIPFADHPKIMQEKIVRDLRDDMIGSPIWQGAAY